MIEKKILTVFATLILAIIFSASTTKKSSTDSPRRLEILFLGHKSLHHSSEMLADIFTKEYFKSGINITYTTEPNDLNENNLEKYDGLIVYANYDTISPSQEKALLNFVSG